MEDAYQWLEDLNSPQSLEWVDHQNQRTKEKWTKSTRFEEFRQTSLSLLSQQDKLTVGSVYQGFVYHLWQDASHPMGLWRRAPLESLLQNPEWELLINFDQWAVETGQSAYLQHVEFLNGSERVLLSLSPDGKDAVEIHEWDLKTKGFVSDGFTRPLAKDDLVWINENQVLWASTKNPTECGYTSQIYFWQRGQEPELIMEVPKSSMKIWSLVASDEKNQPQTFLCHMINWDETEIHLWRDGRTHFLELPKTAWFYGLYEGRIVLWLQKPWQSFAQGSILISKQPGNFEGLSAKDFETIFEPRAGQAVQDLAVSKIGVAVSFSDQLKNQISIWRVGKLTATLIPESVTVDSVFSSVEKDNLFTSFQSFLIPPGWSRLESFEWKPIQRSNLHFKTENVTAKQEWATSLDGTKIPYWVVFDHSKSLPRPTLQLGYGGFLASSFPTYNSLIGNLWIERGGIFALAQIRGGGEFGVAWHEAAKLKNKQKSYDDFIAVSEDLIAKGYTTSKQLAIRGRSNGGLLVGATITQRPDLYGAALIEVPLLDMLRYTELPPGSSWKEEYGDPKDPEMREVILKYSPYQNVEKNLKYPPILIRTARSDDRVHPSHARKMAAKLQALGHEVWFYEETVGGHGSTPVTDQAFQMALVYEFLWNSLS